jgi:hypothetical protein
MPKDQGEGEGKGPDGEGEAYDQGEAGPGTPSEALFNQ